MVFLAFDLKRLIFGRPLKTSEESHERLSVFRALPVLAPDALSSVAYGPQQTMLVLFLAGGAAALRFAPWVALSIAGLLFLLVLSYAQICLTYPNGGGAYIVSRENLGETASLFAGAALFIGYTFTVSTSVAAGADAITSAFPALLPWHVQIALFYILIITVMNLRGVSESASAFSWPLYAFLGGMYVLLFAGLLYHGPVLHLAGAASAGAAPTAAVPSAGQVGGLAGAGGTIGLYVLLRAFSSGSSTLTGVEAVSNGVPIFRAPQSRSAQMTLAMMALLLGSMMLGMAYLGFHLHVNPTLEQTVLAQLGGLIFHGVFRPLFYYVQLMASVVLILAANTSYNGFPIMASVMAEHRVMPNMFTNRGDRLVFNNGILALTLMAAFFVVILHGSTTDLIAPYSAGVFLGFTLSQTGNGVYCWKNRIAGWRWRAAVSFVGALVTFTAMWVFLITKFARGAWMILVIIPLLFAFFSAVRAHYRNLASELRLPRDEPLPAKTAMQSLCIVPVSNLNRMVVETMRYASTFSSHVIAVNVAFSEEQSQAFRVKWEERYPEVRLVSLISQYRQVLRTVVRFVGTLDAHTDEDTFITVLIPEFVPRKLWQHLLHNQLGLRLYGALKYYKAHVVVATVPYRLRN